MKVKVRFQVQYDTEIEVDSVDGIENAANDVFIPEHPSVEYVDDSFDVISITDENDREVDYI